MNIQVKILSLKSIFEIPGYWTDADLVNLLDAFGFPDAQNASPAELPELLELAISDFEPDDAAKIVLEYKLTDKLSTGKIGNMSHEMMEDDESDESSDISLHYPLFNINQLLHDAYNGVFPRSKASKIEVELVPVGDDKVEINKEILLKAIAKGLSDRNLIVRLFEDQLKGEAKFNDADNIIWEMTDLGQNQYSFITSDNWISREDIVDGEFETTVKLYQEPHH
jgi:hypothetical protein